MKASNLYLHPAITRQPGALLKIERKTGCTAVVVRRGKVVQLIPTAEFTAGNGDDPRPAA